MHEGKKKKEENLRENIINLIQAPRELKNCESVTNKMSERNQDESKMLKKRLGHACGAGS